MPDRAKTLQLMNDASRIIAVGYRGLLMLGPIIMQSRWAALHLSSASRTGITMFMICDIAMFLLMWPIMAFLLGHRLWLWAYVSTAAFLALPFVPSMLTDMGMLVIPVVLFVAGFMLWGIGLSGAWLARRIHVDRRLDRWRYWRAIAVPCICLFAYTATAGQDAALRTISKQVHTHDPLSNYTDGPNIAYPVICKYPKHGAHTLYMLDPTGKVIIVTGECFD